MNETRYPFRESPGDFTHDKLKSLFKCCHSLQARLRRLSMALRHERRRPRAMRGVRGVCPPVKALKAGKAPDRKRVQNGSCGQNNFASEDQRLWTEGRKIIAFGFFLFHRWKSTNRAGAIPVFALQHGIALRVKRLQIEHITQRVN